MMVELAQFLRECRQDRKVPAPALGKKIQEVNIMNKSELIAEVAEKAAITKKDADAAVSAVIASITEALQKGEKVQLVGFGTFEIRERSARTGRNPRTNSEIEIPASKSPAFKAGKALKDAVNK